jgi:hypothetical protein
MFFYVILEGVLSLNVLLVCWILGDKSSTLFTSEFKGNSCTRFHSTGRFDQLIALDRIKICMRTKQRPWHRQHPHQFVEPFLYVGTLAPGCPV